jgi:hypothetical protein
MLAVRDDGLLVALKVVNTTKVAEVEIQKMLQLMEFAPRLYAFSEDGGHKHVQRILALCPSCKLGDRIRNVEEGDPAHRALAAHSAYAQLRQPGGKIGGAAVSEVSVIVSELYPNLDLTFWLRRIEDNASVCKRFFAHLIKGLAHMMRHGCRRRAFPSDLRELPLPHPP